MKYTLVVDRADRFEKLYLGFITGGNVLHRSGETRTRDERGKEAAILRQLKSISTEAPTNEDTGMRRLKDTGVIELDAKQFELLKKYLEAAPFPTQESDAVDDMLDWVWATTPESVG